MVFKKVITDWYRENKRDLPWRNTRNPYHIWLSEIILQQTRVAQGQAYYLRFIEAYPTIFDLAKDDLENVLKLWQGLGYYSRARNLHFTANHVVNEYNGVFPSEYKEIRSLKGIGDYTAAAIASFSFGRPYSVVDGNVYRVLSRFCGVSTPIDTVAGKKEFAQIAEELLDRENPGEYNQAIMEFGALHCKPDNPLCDSCPLQLTCQAYIYDKVELLPIKEKKTKVKKVFLYYIVAENDRGEVIIKQRPEKGVWAQLFDFPEIVSDTRLTQKRLKERLKEEMDIELKGKLSPVFETKHILSHREIYAEFIQVKQTDPASSVKHVDQGRVIHRTEINQFPLSRLVDKFVNETSFLL